MKKSILILIGITAGTLGTFLLTAPSRAQSVNFVNVMPFVSPSGRIGFFDQSNGKIFIYDNDARECVFRGQLTELGKQIMHLEKKSTSTSTTPVGSRGQIKIERGIPSDE